MRLISLILIIKSAALSDTRSVGATNIETDSSCGQLALYTIICLIDPDRKLTLEEISRQVPAAPGGTTLETLLEVAGRLHYRAGLIEGGGVTNGIPFIAEIHGGISGNHFIVVNPMEKEWLIIDTPKEPVNVSKEDLRFTLCLCVWKPDFIRENRAWPLILSLGIAALSFFRRRGRRSRIAVASAIALFVGLLGNESLASNDYKAITLPLLIKSGSVHAGEEVTFEIPIKNGSNQDIRVTRILKSCSCTSLTPSAPLELIASQSVVLRGRISTAGQDGLQMVSVTLSTNERDGPNYQVKISYTVKNEVKAFPKELSIIVLPENKYELRTLFLQQDKDVKIIRVRSTVSWIQEQSKVRTDSGYEYIFRFYKTGSTAPLKGELLIDTSTEAGKIRIPVTKIDKPSIDIFPSHLFFNEVPVGQSATRIVIVKIRPDATLERWLASDCVTVSQISTKEWEITYCPESPGIHQENLTIICKIKNKYTEELLVPLSAWTPPENEKEGL